MGKIFFKRGEQMSKNSSSEQLFEGQTTHPLSQEEKAELFKKCRLINPDENSNQQFSDAINVLNQTPTGAQTLRYMLEADDTFRFDMKGNPNSTSVAAYTPISDVVTFHADLTHEPTQMAMSLAHEATHDLQSSQTKYFARALAGKSVSKVLHDAETQALTQQLAYELNVNSSSDLQIEVIAQNNERDGLPPKEAKEAAISYTLEPDTEYNQVYAASYKMWQEYAHNPEKTPKGCLKFTPKEGVDIEEAKEAYVKQMASQHTRAIFAKDFVAHAYPETSNEGATHFNAEFTVSAAQAYREKDKNSSGDVVVPFKMVEDMKKRNPLVRQPDYNPIRKAHGQPEVKYASNVNQENKEATLSSVTNQEVMAPKTPEQSATSKAVIQPPQTALAQAEPPVQAPVTPEQSAASEAVIQPPQAALAQAKVPVQAPKTPLTNNDPSLETQEVNAPRLSKNSMAATLLIHGQNISQENDINPITLQQMNGQRTA